MFKFVGLMDIKSIKQFKIAAETFCRLLTVIYDDARSEFRTNARDSETFKLFIHVNIHNLYLHSLPSLIFGCIKLELLS